MPRIVFPGSRKECQIFNSIIVWNAVDMMDDLGREKGTEWATERLYVLIDHRYANLLPTVVTTNFDLDELVERGYDATVSRLVEGSAAIRLTASDYRAGVRP